jgi:hypothetical protein
VNECEKDLGFLPHNALVDIFDLDGVKIMKIPPKSHLKTVL